MMPSRKNNRRRQRGAIGVLSAAVLLLMLLVAALALDTGRLFFEKRQLQQRADLAALAAAQRYCDGFSSVADARAEVLASLSANGFDPDASSNSVDVLLGETQSINFRRNFIDTTTDQSAQVQLTRTVPASLLAGGLLGGQVTLQAQSTAQRDLIGALSAGAALADVDTGESALLNPLLGALLGAPLNISAAGYNGLIHANTELLHLRDAMASAGVVASAGTAEEVANANLTMGQFLQVMAQALAADGHIAAATTINNIYTAIQATATASEPLALADILVVEGPYAAGEQALRANLNAMALLTASAMAINRNQFVTANLAVATTDSTLLQNLLGNTLNTQLVLQIIEPPTIAIGRFGFDENGQPRTLARTAQVSARLVLNLNVVPSAGGFAASLLNLIASINGSVSVTASAARGEAWLDHISRCPALQSRQFEFGIGARPQPVSVRLGHADNSALPATLSLGIVGNLISAQANLGANLTLAAAAQQTVAFDVDLSAEDALPTPARGVGADLSASLQSGLDNLGSQAVSNITLHVIVIPISINTAELASDLAQIMAPILREVVQLTLEPALRLLGVDLGEVDVRLLGVEEGHGALLL